VIEGVERDETQTLVGNCSCPQFTGQIGPAGGFQGEKDGPGRRAEHDGQLRLLIPRHVQLDEWTCFLTVRICDEEKLAA
jgi:hypothetical protein